MAEEKVNVHDINFRRLFPFTELFQGFQIGIDPKKLLLAAGGILSMAVVWWLLAVGFDAIGGREPALSDFTARDVGDEKAREDDQRNQFIREHDKWDLLQEAAGPDGTLRQWPWFEHRGPNPYLLVKGLVQGQFPWAKGDFLGWFVSQNGPGPFMVEPLVKFLRPVIYLLDPRGGFVDRVYFLLVIVGTLAVWAVFGGAITRMAAVQIARKEKIGMMEALRFATSKFLSFFSAPVFPLLGIAFFVVLLVLFGLPHLIPVFGDIVWDGLLWPLVLLAGLAMAVILIGLIGWPLMYATISTEGSDSFDALSRSYSYVLQNPWSYFWYGFWALAYGVVVVFFVGFMGSLMVYLGKWGVSQTPFVTMTHRDPEYLFVYAPESFHWRELLLQGSPAVVNGQTDPNAYQPYVESLRGWNKVGAFMVAIWLYLVFLLILGFGYSYFWSASTIIYLLMRRKVEDTELDEVYLEEDETEEAYSTALPPVTTSAPTSATVAAPVMVDAPSLKSSAPPPLAASPPPARVESTPADAGKSDGNPPGGAP